MGSLDHVSSTSFQAYRTPRELGKNLVVEYDLALDVAADAKNALTPAFLDCSVDGLKMCWLPGPGRGVWCNPPYNDVPPWLVKGHHEVYVAGNCSRAVFLVPFAAGVSWFTDAVTKYEVFLFDERIKFEVPPYEDCPPEFRDKLYRDGKPVRSPGGGNALIVMEPSGLIGVTGLRSSKTGALMMDFITGEFYGDIDAR
jgi:phage N-6-adenine-methyltransferase